MKLARPTNPACSGKENEKVRQREQYEAQKIYDVYQQLHEIVSVHRFGFCIPHDRDILQGLIRIRKSVL